ncbi:hypothetical protein BO82DRAFT_363236 [Aspergillus uvarum CBS 121591]|uniref:Uncharacterized protein n=1 Tax=Aspergillus uvarum CBS 121591 TaxID=1448315 RepID=A0A319D6U2_9EURO|nr:hypothetical protein BO82DRAFT_363236 [Aspergillus uvarum CBS 121591]PYH83668.1 hypothetical protein BO82DRAFT_363236 [Aspergillus uvarum CBS 121591]
MRLGRTTPAASLQLAPSPRLLLGAKSAKHPAKPGDLSISIRNNDATVGPSMRSRALSTGSRPSADVCLGAQDEPLSGGPRHCYLLMGLWPWLLVFFRQSKTPNVNFAILSGVFNILRLR